MKKENIILLLVNIIGGAAVIISYIIPIATYSGPVMDFWGKTPAHLISTYTVFMLLAAVSYLVFTPLLIFKTKAKEVTLYNRFSYRWFSAAYALILIPSIGWMALTQAYLNTPSEILWTIIEIDLLLVGVGSIFLFILFLGMKPKKPTIWYWISIPFLLLFIFQTAILDPFLWTAGFRG